MATFPTISLILSKLVAIWLKVGGVISFRYLLVEKSSILPGNFEGVE